MRKKVMKRFGETRKRKEQDKGDTGDNKKVQGVVQKWSVFLEKELNKITNLDQKTWKQ